MIIHVTWAYNRAPYGNEIFEPVPDPEPGFMVKGFPGLKPDPVPEILGSDFADPEPDKIPDSSNPFPFRSRKFNSDLFEPDPEPGNKVQKTSYF